MSQHSDQERTIALAGVFQGARLVRDLARLGQADSRAQTASLDSLFVFDADRVIDVFSGIDGIELGLNTLIAQLELPRDRDLEIARYAVATIHHGDQLTRDPQRMERLTDALSGLNNRSADFDLSDNSRGLQIGHLYQEMISGTSPPIMVRGEPLYLQNTDLAARIRACLLASIRAAILWRQCGGSKFQLLFRRRQLAALAHQLLAHALQKPTAGD